jgi:hypothetical protein
VNILYYHSMNYIEYRRETIYCCCSSCKTEWERSEGETPFEGIDIIIPKLPQHLN